MKAPHCEPNRSPNDDRPQFEPECIDPKCRVCGGTGKVQALMYSGRYRTRVEIARMFIARREWKGARVAASGTSVYIRKGSACMRLDHFSAEEIASLKIPVLRP